MAHKTSPEASGISRRTVLEAGASTLTFLLPAAQAASATTEAQPEGLSKHAWPVRTVDAADSDFTDLDPIADAIGSARVVQLGEPSHGAGTAFSAKARLVKFLHQRLGFDLLIWESGLYDVSLAQAGMRGTDDAITAARRGVFSLWTEAAEARPVFELVKASQATPRPIEMAGFDMQVTANGSTERCGLELKAFATALRHTATQKQAGGLAAAAVDARRRCFTTRFASVADFEALTVATSDLRKLIRSQARHFEAVWGADYTAFLDRIVGNIQADAAQRFEAARSPKTTPERENRRDALNAENIRWLLEERHPRRKAIIWAHNVHVMKAWYSSDFRDVHLRPRTHDMKPTGVFLSEWLGRQSYTMGMTTYEGSEGMAVGGPVTPIPPSQEGTLEAQLHSLGFPYAFLNLRTLRKPATARLPKFETVYVDDPSRVFDGILFIDRMSPATRG